MVEKRTSWRELVKTTAAHRPPFDLEREKERERVTRRGISMLTLAVYSYVQKCK